jgi:tetratricopeptide (TPR) repeat protein
MHQYDRALEDSNHPIKLDQTNIHAYLVAGVAHVQMQSYDAAIAAFDRALQLDPRGAPAFDWRGAATLKKADDASGNADVMAANALIRTALRTILLWIADV